ncbi:MAG: PAS domain S-box protein [Bacteroidota bacterium]
MSFNKLLERQIKKTLSEEMLAEPSIKKLLESVNESYNSYDRDKKLSEQALKIVEEDYIAINNKLNDSFDQLNKEVIKTLSDSELLVESFNDINSYDLLIENIKVQIELITQSDISSLYFLNESENKLKLFYQKGLSQEDQEEVAKHLMNGYLSNVLSTGQSLFITDADKEPDIQTKFNVNKSRSIIYIPIKSTNKVIGLLSIESKSPNAFTEIHLSTLKVFAALAGDTFNAIYKNNLIKKQNAENEKLSKLATSTLYKVIYTDSAGKITWVNKHFENTTGYLLSEIIGKTPGSFLCGPATEEEKTKELRVAIREQKPCSVVITNYTKQGQEFKVAVQLSPIFDEEGELQSYVSIQQDVTELERNRIELENQKSYIEDTLNKVSKSEKQYSTLLKITNELITSLDPAGNIVFVNESWLTKMNYQLEEVIGSNIFSYIHPASQAHCAAFFKDIQTKKMSFLEVKYSLISKNGLPIEIEGQVHCIIEAGSITSINSFLEDVSEINKLKLDKETKTIELQESKNRLETVLNSLNETVWGRSIETDQLEYISHSAIGLFGMALDDWYANSNLWLEVIHPDDRARVEKENENLFEVGEITSEYRIITGHKEVKWILNNVKVLKNEHGAPFFMIGISKDITTKKITEINLINYKQAIDESAIVSITDLEGNITYANDKFCEISQYSREELLGKNHRLINSGFHPKEFFEDLWKTISAGKIWTGEIKNKAKDGSFYYVESTIIPFMENGKPQKYMAIRYPSTEKVLAKLEIEEQKQFYETILNHIPGNVAVFDEKGNYLFINPNTVKDATLRKWLIGKNNYDYCTYRGLTMDLAIDRDNQFKILRENGKAISSVEKRQTKDGQTAYTSSNLILHEYKGEKLMIAYAIDITDLKNAEAKVIELTEFYQNILNNIPVDIAVFDDQHKYLYLNKEAVKNDEIREWLIGRDDFDYANLKGLPLLSESAQFRRNQFNNTIQTGMVSFWLESIPDSTGEIKYKERRFHTYDDKKYVVGYAVDVTTLKQKEIDNEKITRDIFQRNKDLEQFSYIVSHNIRLPVANIMGFAKILNSDNLDKADQKQFFNALITSIKNLDEVIVDLNDILQVRRDINEKKEKIVFSKLIQNIIDSIQDTINQVGAKIITNFDAIDEFYSIRSYMHSILYNLIINSIKYKQVDIPIIIQVKSELLQNKLILSVRDNGSGIDLTKNKDLIFGLYKRFHKKVEGKGMGLYMVKTQVESLNGKISIESEVNIGTEFKIEFELYN